MRIQQGEHLSPATEFQKGQHWRPKQPWWDKAWLENEYLIRNRSSASIAKEGGVTDGAILFWLGKHGIPRRSVAQVRQIQKWGCPGSKNPMFGKTGALNPNWEGGLTPARQKFYASHHWKTAVRKLRTRDPVCRLCGHPENLQIHHIDRFANAPLLAFDIGNLIRLCQPCHLKLRGKEEKYKKLLFSLIPPSTPGML